MTAVTKIDTATDAPGLTHEVARFVHTAKSADLPAVVVENGKKSILDGLGLALSGSVATSGEYVRRHLDDIGAVNGTATVIGTDRKVPPRFAAFANGVGIHADDYDDTQLAVAKDRVYGLLTHPTAPALPSALAMGETLGASGADVMLAYHIGVEVECKIAEAINPRHYQTGFHATATCGTYASAAAAGRLMGLDVEHVRIGTNHNLPNALIHHRPQNELQAKFSMQFCMAILLIEGRAGLNEFTDEVVLRDDVKAMISKVDFVVDERAEAAGYHLMTTYIDIKLKDGRTISGMADFGKGSPANPMSYDEVATKFLECAEFARWDMGKAREVVGMVSEFEKLADIRKLMALVSN